MTNLNSKEVVKAWWQSAASRANRWYAIGIALATLLAFSMPHILGYFIPCAKFMEVEWIMVAFTGLAGVGLLNMIVLFFAPFIEQILPQWCIPPLRALLLVVIPLLVLFGTMWFSFAPFWYALLNDPVLLCD